MPVTPAQKAAIEEVIHVITATTAPRGKRQLAAMFMDLVDREAWPEYYEVIPEPRSIKQVQQSVDKGRYKEATDAYTDLSLVFYNALFYNEAESQIALDAQTLKNLLDSEWRKRTVLPSFRSSPPPSSAQKVHGTADQNSKPTEKLEIPKPKSKPSMNPPTQSLNSAAGSSQQPAGAGSTSQAAAKSVSIQPRLAPRESSDADVEVDIMSDGVDDDAGAFQVDRDPYSEEIVKQLEKGLPRWPGFGEEGWMNDVPPERLTDIVHAIKSHKDVIGNRIGAALESVPEETSPALNLPTTTPLSLKQIETRTRHKVYKTAQEFDKDMSRLFLKARRYYEANSEAYGRVLLLQRLYQALTSMKPLSPPYVSQTNFASLKAGPGNVKPVHGPDAEGVANVTSHRVLSKDRVFVDEINYKGWKIRLADWLHLANPGDPSKPIIGQVFRCWMSDEIGKKGQPGITVSWYYRPEQTLHPATRQFWEGEVFKTSHFADHPVEDIIEKIACQFTARHIRGRPRPPYWYVGFPLYVCDSRYNDRDRVFVRIKNWNSCVPEEVRQSSEFMPIYPFERNVYPAKLPSPFLVKGAGKGAAKGPGGIIEVSPEQAAIEAEHARKRGGAPAPATAAATRPSSAAPAPTATTSYQQYQPQNVYSAYYPNYQQQQTTPRPPGPDRSVVTAAGGYVAIGGPSQVEKLPTETAKLFDRDPETNEVLWFAAPPLSTPRPTGPRHSLAYLHFLANKRKERPEDEEGDRTRASGMDVDGMTGGGSAKRSRLAVPPTATETIRQVLKDLGLESLQR